MLGGCILVRQHVVGHYPQAGRIQWAAGARVPLRCRRRGGAIGDRGVHHGQNRLPPALRSSDLLAVTPPEQTRHAVKGNSHTQLSAVTFTGSRMHLHRTHATFKIAWYNRNLPHGMALQGSCTSVPHTWQACTPRADACSGPLRKGCTPCLLRLGCLPTLHLLL